jgi:hypothetical protein
MPRKVTPMKMHNFYCSEELWKAMQERAIEINESDSEYIRRAVEQRNAQYKQEIYPEFNAKMRAVTEKINKPPMVQTFQKGGK